ncbi:hypothetical protein Pd630_LPD09143 (plasmid) [Rhodococcus opacus PD630]|nr:hypothetical protein Pd630_LPD09143 [Rhodococcus opacus PD630]
MQQPALTDEPSSIRRHHLRSGSASTTHLDRPTDRLESDA